MSDLGGVAVRECALGKGVFATRRFAAGDEILWLHGRVIGLGEILQASNEQQGYPLQVAADPPLYLDLAGTDAQYLNHSCDPNAAAQDTTLVALRLIEPGEEIRFDYATTAAGDGWVMLCQCGSQVCRHVIVSDFAVLPLALQARYLRDAAHSSRADRATDTWPASTPVDPLAAPALPEVPEEGPAQMGGVLSTTKPG